MSLPSGPSDAQRALLLPHLLPLPAVSATTLVLGYAVPASITPAGAEVATALGSNPTQDSGFSYSSIFRWSAVPWHVRSGFPRGCTKKSSGKIHKCRRWWWEGANRFLFLLHTVRLLQTGLVLYSLSHPHDQAARCGFHEVMSVWQWATSFIFAVSLSLTIATLVLCFSIRHYHGKCCLDICSLENPKYSEPFLQGSRDTPRIENTL